MKKLLQVPTTDVVWLRCALADALNEKAVLAPLAPGMQPLPAALAEQVQPETAVIIRTSGSTGVPKAVELSANALLSNAAATHETLGGEGQWLTALPLHLMGGLGQLVRSHLSGIAPEFAGGSAAEIIAAIDRMQHETRYLSVVPVQMASLLEIAEQDSGVKAALQGFAAILVGGGALSVALRQKAWELGVNIVRTYGATETAGGCVYDGVEIGDTRVRVRDGEVQLAGSNLALGYLADPQLTTQVFVTDGAERWYRTGDAGNLLGGMLEITGRRDRVFVSGGTNVSLDVIEQVLGAAASDMQWCATAVADAKWGQRAVLVYAGAGEIDAAAESELVAELKAKLGAAASPVAFLRIAEIPYLAGGKVDHAAIAAYARAHVQPAG